jgi:hypothetical protein
MAWPGSRRRAGRAAPKKAAPRGKPTPRTKKARSSILDAKALAYRKLLLNPRTAELAYPLYGGSNNGYLVRASQTFDYGSAVGETAGYLHWVP